jgi:hypothetical protein
MGLQVGKKQIRLPACPRQICWRKDQYTFIIGDEQTDFVEDIYAKIDTDFAPFMLKYLQRRSH